MDGTKRVIELPDLIPVLPVRNTVLFPNAAVPLIVGRAKSVRTVREAQKHGDILLVVTQKDGAKEEPKHEDLYSVGVVCLVSKIHQVEKESFQLIANGLFRFRVSQYVEGEGFLAARGYQIPEITSSSPKAETLGNEIKNLGKSILNLAATPGSDTISKLFQQIQDPAQIADLCCTFLHLPIPLKQELLEMMDLEKRLEKLLELMVREKERLLIQNEIQGKMMERLSKDQRDHLLREQIKTLHEELGDDNDIIEEYLKKIEAAGFPPEARKIADEELGRLRVVQRSSPEYHVIRTYLDWLVALPWSKSSAKAAADIDLKKAREILDADHYGIDKVKNRILEFLAVTKLKKDLKGPILCLSGPPGVGKTSIAKSIAKALGREFIRTSLGGVRDEAEIRGHRRTYIGALPGRVMQAMKRAGVKDPLILLDEVDKIGLDFRGDPASALLEVLDPEQNNTFTDHYIDIPYDLSRVFFVTTANMLDTVPPALRDRLEIIEMTSYSKSEKMEIAKTYLIPKVFEEHGIKPEQLEIPKQTLDLIIEHYTREAGVRNLTRELAHLCRAAATELASDEPVEKVVMTPDKLEQVLGPKRFFSETVTERTKPGVVTGLAWTPVGGEILNIEVTKMEGRGNLILTGQLGEVMKESAQIALSLIRAQLGRNVPFRFDRTDFHIHVPAGAIPKDGPSAGTAIFLALASLVQGKAVSTKIAMTGEITLRGTVLPVGGIKEKVIAAHRAGIETILLPERNQGDLRDVSPEVKNAMKFHFIKDVSQLLQLGGLNDLGFIGTHGLPPSSPTTNVPVPVVTN
jgi:ATP-dependent Lon protease